MVQSHATMPPSTRSTVSAPRRRPVGAHRLEQVAGLVADGFQRRAGDLGRRRNCGVSPKIAPRASASHQGAPRPTKAGTR